MKLKIAYFGTPDFSARLLEKIILDKDLPVEVVLVVTQPDKPIGRKQILTPSPVKIIAQKNNIQLYNGDLTHLPSTINNLLSSSDLALLYAYGEIINKDLIKAPKHGFWNIHPSLLPKYRGASPISYPLLLGETETGVTLMQMDEELDHGPIIAQQKYTILPNVKRSDLEIKLTDLGFELFKKTVQAVIPVKAGIYTNRSPIRSGMTIVESNAQDDSLATYTRRLTKQDGYVPLTLIKKALNNELLSFDELPELLKEYYSSSPVIPSESQDESRDLAKRNSSKIIFNYFRGLHVWPGLWTKVIIDGAEKRLKITDMSLVDIRSTTHEIRINKVQLEGKKEVDFKTFNNTYSIL